jgi:conjugal transfer mating pair stabilization protein TraN
MRAKISLLAAALLAGSALSLPVPALAQQICAADLNGNGDADDPGETASCTLAADASWQCPLQQVACTGDAVAGYACPLGDAYACKTSASGGTPTCSPNICVDLTVTPIEEEPLVDDPGVPADGAMDADGNCVGNIEIFSGRAMRCRPPGLKTTFSNCCKDKSEIVKDGMGSSIGVTVRSTQMLGEQVGVPPLAEVLQA